MHFNINLVRQVRAAVVQRSSLDAGLVRHDFQLRVEAGAAGRAEEVLVDLARGTGNIVIRRFAYESGLSVSHKERSNSVSSFLFLLN